MPITTFGPATSTSGSGTAAAGLFGRASSDLLFTSTGIFTIASGLALNSLPANSTFNLQGVIHISRGATTGTNTAVQMNWSYPTGATMRYSVVGTYNPQSGNASSTYVLGGFVINGSPWFNTQLDTYVTPASVVNNADAELWISGHVVTSATPGTLTPSFATTNGGETYIRTGSWLSLVKVA